MKLGPRDVRFVRRFLPTLTRQLRFVARRGGMHLQETALVIEGELHRFYFFGLETFFARALSEWTTVTVPYSRIEQFGFRSLTWFRWASALIVTGAWIAGLYWAIFHEPVAGAIILSNAFGATVLLGYVNLRIRAFYVLKFQTRNGQRVMLSFRVVAKPLRQKFADILAAHRKTAAQFESQTVPRRDTFKKRWSLMPRDLLGTMFSSFGVICLAVIGVIATLWAGFGMGDDYESPSWIPWLAIPVLGLGFIAIGAFVIAPFQAKKRGFSFWLWFLTGILVLNPIYLLVVLAASPHRARQRLREQFTQELNALLKGLVAPMPDRRPIGVPLLSIGDETTRAPLQSLGDLQTTDVHRSLGDAPTRE